MGKLARIHREQRRREGGEFETHEPPAPRNWPLGHVRVDRTSDDLSIAECIKVTIHGHIHYLHDTTARALQVQLEERLAEYNEGLAKDNAELGLHVPPV